MSADAVAWLEHQFQEHQTRLFMREAVGGRVSRPMVQVIECGMENAVASWPVPEPGDDLDVAEECA